MGQKEGTVKQSQRWIKTITAVLLLVLVAAGCDSFNGGGWLRSASTDPVDVMNNEKANFGINGKCRETNHPEFGQVAGLYNGKFEYHDQALGVKFNGDVEPAIFFVAPFNDCKAVEELLDGLFIGVAEFHGTYRPQPNGAPGEFVGHISDNGEPGFEGDTFSITLEGGQYNGYTNFGPIEGGNIQVS